MGGPGRLRRGQDVDRAPRAGAGGWGPRPRWPTCRGWGPGCARRARPWRRRCPSTAGDPGHLDPGAELQLVAGDGGPDGAPDQPGLDAVGGQGVDQGGAGGLDLRSSMTWALARLSSLAGGSCQSPTGASTAARAARPGRAGWPPRAGVGIGVRRRPAPTSSGSSAATGATARRVRLGSTAWRHGGHRGLTAFGEGRDRTGRWARRRSAAASSSTCRRPGPPSPWTAPTGRHGRRAEATDRTDTPVNTSSATATTITSTTAAPNPPRARPSGSAITAPTQPPADDSAAVEACRLGEPPAMAASPETASSRSVPPMTARAGSRRERRVVLAPVHQEPDADGHQHQGDEEASPAEQVPHAHPGVVPGGSEGVAVEGDAAQDAQGDQHHAPQVGGVPGGDRPHRRQEPARRVAGRPAVAGSALRRPGSSSRRRCGSIGTGVSTCPSAATPRIDPPGAWWRSSQCDHATPQGPPVGHPGAAPGPPHAIRRTGAHRPTAASPGTRPRRRSDGRR